ncbi:prolyl oligopeptidase family serine peptidase [Methylobacillus gramineus]|uniref:alpha/beta hydrolase n=1 Tax=Methylobacillus gramineus TaxID=755169 RepID=UPI001CFF64A5|nr:alpha/beta hydrolase-fold protein [Methylobacillus gramineus]MCB5184063.1 prolyl oligopeptidase family serine peptidase [Methylobacillus gramineus]
MAALVMSTPLTQAQDSTQPWHEATLPIAQQRDMVSAVTGKTYRIFLYQPAGTPPAEGYPVIYVLDGNTMFSPVAMLVHGQSQRRDATGIIPAIVIGIGYPTKGLLDEVARAEDYTPPAPDLSNTGDTRATRQGGADKFLEFIETELKPQLKGELPINPSKQALFGHSYGGLFTLHVLFTKPQAFQTYIASSPSIWWNQQYILQERQHFAPQDDAGKRLLLMVGSLEQQAPANVENTGQRLAHAQRRRMVDAARELTADLQGLKPSILDTHFYIQPGENHGSAMLTGTVRAVEFFVGQRSFGKEDSSKP